MSGPGLTALWLVAGLLFGSSDPAVALDKVSLQLKWQHQFQFAGYYAAIAQGYYAEEGLEVELREVVLGEAAVDTVLEGRSQYGVADSSLVLSRLQGKKVVVLAAIFQHSPLVLLTLQSSGIVSPYDLAGKRVMYRRNIDDAVLTAMFVEAGLQDGDYIHVPQTFKAEALLGEADAISAYTTNQPYYFQQHNIPINIIAPSNYGIDFYGDMLFTSEDYLRDNPEQVLAFRRASIKGWDYAVRHPEEVVDWMLANLPRLDKNREHLLYEAERTIRLIKPELIEVGYFGEKRLWRIAEIYKQLGLAEGSAELSGIDYRDHLARPRVAPRIVKAGAILALVATLATLFMFWVNRRLKSLVAERTEQVYEVNAELERRQKLLDHHVATCSTDLDGVITGVSEAYCRLTGYSPQDLLGHHARILVHSDNIAPDQQGDTLLSALPQQLEGEIHLCSRLSNNFWVHYIVESLQAPNGDVIGCEIIFEDISDKKKIMEMSTTDSLTRLANRRKIEESLEQCIRQGSRYQRSFSVILLDIDHFKRINDNFGHTCGDEVLVALAQLLRNSVREVDLAGRWGGEEFLVVCPETELEGARALAELLRSRVAETELLAGQAVTCSFGVAQWQQGMSAKAVFRLADQALYEAKGQGRNRVVVHA